MHSVLMISCDQCGWLASSLHMTRAKESLYKEYEVLHIAIYILCSQRWRNSTKSTKTRPGADCGSDLEFPIAKFKLKLKKVGKTTNLNQIPYDYTVEVKNRFKGLDPIECLMNYGLRFVTLYRRQ